jgi:hypothetical protein
MIKLVQPDALRFLDLPNCNIVVVEEAPMHG